MASLSSIKMADLLFYSGQTVKILKSDLLVVLFEGFCGLHFVVKNYECVHHHD